MITTEQANEIAEQMFRAAGHGNRSIPVVDDNNDLDDGQHWERADLRTEEKFRAQCRAWIEGAVYDWGIQRFKVGDGHAETTVEAESMDEAEKLAREWVLGGDYEIERTAWVHVSLVAEDGTEGEMVVPVHPTDPKCTPRGAEHDWQSPLVIVGGLAENPGVWGHGGGAVECVVCLRCGIERVTDTWATDPDGGRQGMTEIHYETEPARENLQRLAVTK